MAAANTKPWLTASEQIDRLKSRGVHFSLMSEDDARAYLEKNSIYFGLRAYRLGFPKVEEGNRKGEYANLDFYAETETSDTRAYEQALDIEYIVHREMQRSGLSKSELTKRMGVSLQSLSKLLNSQPNMTLKTVTKFELALGIKIIPQVISGYSNEAPFFLSNAISMAYGHAKRYLMVVTGLSPMGALTLPAILPSELALDSDTSFQSELVVFELDFACHCVQM